MRTTILIIIAASCLNGIEPPVTLAGEQVCSLPADVGPCDGVCPRYFYDVCTGQCELFNYGCCEGNANNFETLEACEASCPPEEDICFLPSEHGPCEGVCQRIFYNVCTGECEPFVYGCCDGNANNFLTIEECEEACPFEPCHPADFNFDGVVGPVDLAMLLGSWGPCEKCCDKCGQDLDGDGQVSAADLAMLLGAWGPCEP